MDLHRTPAPAPTAHAANDLTDAAHDAECPRAACTADNHTAEADEWAAQGDEATAQFHRRQARRAGNRDHA